MELKSGKTVKINKLTMAERQECEDATEYLINPDGSQTIRGMAKARNMWCMKGIGCELEDLAGYSTEDLGEIAGAVRAESGEFGDPISEEG